MACLTCILEKKLSRYHVLNHSAIQIWLDRDSWDQPPRHGCHHGQLISIPMFLLHLLDLFPFKMTVTSCDGAEPVLGTVGI